MNQTARIMPISPPAVGARYILVAIKQQYGQRVLLPADSTADVFCSMMSTKTITQRMVDHIKQLGYEVRVVQDLPETL